jgi:hypothetical protein
METKNDLPENWGVKNDGSDLFKDKVFGYINSKLGVYYCGDVVEYYYGIVDSRPYCAHTLPDIVKLLTIDQFINLTTPTAKKEYKFKVGDRVLVVEVNGKLAKFSATTANGKYGVIDNLPNINSNNYKVQLDGYNFNYFIPEECMTLQFSTTIEPEKPKLEVAGSPIYTTPATTGTSIDFSYVHDIYFGDLLLQKLQQRNYQNKLPTFLRNNIKTNHLKIKINYEHKIKITV